MLITVALMVFSELASHVALTLEHGGHGAVGLLPAFLRAGQADFGHAGANRGRATDEGCAACGAGLLGVVVGEADAFFGDAVDVRCFVAHHAAVVVADVPGSDIVTPDDEDVGFLLLRLSRRTEARQAEGEGDNSDVSWSIHIILFGLVISERDSLRTRRSEIRCGSCRCLVAFRAGQPGGSFRSSPRGRGRSRLW